jgi:perosamine synthetase
MLSFPFDRCEYTGTMPKNFLRKYPNALAILIMNQLKKLDTFNKKRVAIARRYGKIIPGAMYVRYPVQLTSRNIIVKIALKKGILLGNWYHAVIDPFSCNVSSVGYTFGSCPNAERLAKNIANLPTHPRMSDKDIDNVVNTIKREYLI